MEPGKAGLSSVLKIHMYICQMFVLACQNSTQLKFEEQLNKLN